MAASRALKRLLLTGAALAWAPVAVAQTVPAPMVEELIVTASKTGENVREVSGSVSALTGEALTAIGAQSAQDYLSRTPGVVFNRQQPGFSTVTIRGVNTSTSYANLSQGTTGSYINGVPLTDAYFSAGTPDIDTFDVKAVEVYRGPQGTLFGSSSLGGAVNYVANRPDLSGLDAAAFTSLAATEGGSGLSSSYKLMFNAPVVADVLAIRAVAAFRQDQGYIDNAGTGLSNTNDSSVAGGRLMVAWRPAEGLDLNWLSLYQKTKNRDAGYRDPDLDGLTKFTNVPEPTWADVEIHSLTVDQVLPFATLTGQLAYHRKTADTRADLKRFGAFGFELPVLHDAIESEGYTGEIRLASPRGEALEWLIGVMFDETDVLVVENALAANSAAAADGILGPGGGAAATQDASWGVARNDFSGREAALFGEASYTFAERLKLTAGGRLFRTESDSDSIVTGLLSVLTNGTLLSDPPTARQREDGFNPKASISYDLTSSARVYALASKGFRFGGSNINPDPALPRSFESDSLWNYEIGLRSDWLDGALVVDAAAFMIDWSDIPLTVSTGTGTVGVVNAGDAEIRGAEASLSWRVAPGLQFDSNLTYTDAKLVSVAAGAGLNFGVTPGSALPGSSDWRMASSLRYDWSGSTEPFLMISHRYASEAPALLQQFAPPGRNAKVGGYNIFDLRAGITTGRVQWVLFVENLTDEAATFSASYLPPPLANEILDYVARPRTVGVSMNWKL
jgi:iron complex outermembrane receptor protein